MTPTLRILALATAFALTAALPPAPAQTTVRTGSLQPGDPSLDSGESYDEYALEVRPGQEVIAIASAVDFDPYLIVIAPSGEHFENDDYADSPDVALVRTVSSEGGGWWVRVTSYGSGESGDYALVLATRRRTDAETIQEEFSVRGQVPSGRATSVSGSLEAGDPQRTDESWYEAWSIDVEDGARALFLLTSPDFDTYLTLVSPTGRAFSDDDGAGGTDSRLDMMFDESGRWIVVANTLRAGDSGDYTLSVERR